MHRTLARHVRANVVAYIALFFALTAPASAVIITGAMIADESIGSHDLAANSVGSPELANDSVAGGPGGDVRDNTISGSDVNEATLSGVYGLALVAKGSGQTSGQTATAVATCPTGKRVIGSGAQVLGGEAGLASVRQIQPSSGLDAVTVVARKAKTSIAENWGVVAYAMCAKAP